jgi:hypothetical protein
MKETMSEQEVLVNDLQQIEDDGGESEWHWHDDDLDEDRYDE